MFTGQESYAIAVRAADLRRGGSSWNGGFAKCTTSTDVTAAERLSSSSSSPMMPLRSAAPAEALAVPACDVDAKRNNKRPRDDDDDDQFSDHHQSTTAEAKRLKRVMANRRSARESRERREKHVADLESTVVDLRGKSDALERENAALRARVEVLMELSRALPTTTAPAPAKACIPPALQIQLLLLLQQQQQPVASSAISNPAILLALLREEGNAVPPPAAVPPARFVLAENARAVQQTAQSQTQTILNACDSSDNNVLASLLLAEVTRNAQVQQQQGDQDARYYNYRSLRALFVASS